jgi:hypothetical protein
MSLAMYAAPFDHDNNNNELYTNSAKDTLIDRKRTVHNKTQKRQPFPDYNSQNGQNGQNGQNSQNSQKVNAVLQSIHSQVAEDTNNLGDFTFIPPPTSVGVENTKIKESMTNQGSNSNNVGNDEEVDIQSLKNNYMNDKAVEKYYQNLIPNYNQSKYNQTEYNKPYYSTTMENFNISPESDNNKLLMDKLNYMINLLEDQQDERTNNVTEEVVLYSFLGIFIIFIVDSFARVGKYVR